VFLCYMFDGSGGDPGCKGCMHLWPWHMWCSCDTVAQWQRVFVGYVHTCAGLCEQCMYLVCAYACVHVQYVPVRPSYAAALFWVPQRWDGYSP
jgi:hypothetical protein